MSEVYSNGYARGYEAGQQSVLKLADQPAPVAYIEHHKAGDNLVWDNPGGKHTPLYTSLPAQRTWVGLTDDDVRQCSRDVVAGGKENSVDRFAYAIEAKLKEKNT